MLNLDTRIQNGIDSAHWVTTNPQGFTAALVILQTAGVCTREANMVNASLELDNGNIVYIEIRESAKSFSINTDTYRGGGAPIGETKNRIKKESNVVDAILDIIAVTTEF